MNVDAIVASYSPNGLEVVESSGIQAVGSTHLLSTVRTNNVPRVRFSATVGGEAEIEVALV
jgi:hypothetical protein